jgi:LPXTG-motif cell wall-anchored protein
VSPPANSGSTSSAAAITSTPKSLPATGTQGMWLFLASVILIGLGVILQRTRVRRFS